MFGSKSFRIRSSFARGAPSRTRGAPTGPRRSGRANGRSNGMRGLYAPFVADGCSAHRDGHRDRRAREVRIERLPRPEGLLHQCGRASVRALGSRRALPSPTDHGYRPQDRSGVPAGRGWATEGPCFPKDLLAFEQSRRGGSATTFPLLREIGRLNDEAVGGRLSEGRGRAVGCSRTSVWRSSGLPSSRGPTTCASRPPSPSRDGCCVRARRVIGFDPLASAAVKAELPEIEFWRPTPLRRRDRGALPRPVHRVG